MRIYTLKVYFNSAPHPWTFENVSNFATEGGYTRFDFKGERKTEWYPTSSIFRVIEQEREDA